MFDDIDSDDEIFKSVDSYLNDIKTAGEQIEENIAHPNLIFILVMSACGLALLFFCCKIFCTSTHSRKPLFPSYRMREWTNRQRHLEPIGTRCVSLNQGINIPMNAMQQPQGAAYRHTKKCENIRAQTFDKVKERFNMVNL